LSVKSDNSNATDVPQKALLPDACRLLSAKATGYPLPARNLCFAGSRQQVASAESTQQKTDSSPKQNGFGENISPKPFSPSIERSV
jgi:hypothetical protein